MIDDSDEQTAGDNVVDGHNSEINNIEDNNIDIKNDITDSNFHENSNKNKNNTTKIIKNFNNDNNDDNMIRTSVDIINAHENFDELLIPDVDYITTSHSIISKSNENNLKENDNEQENNKNDDTLGENFVLIGDNKDYKDTVKNSSEIFAGNNYDNNETIYNEQSLQKTVSMINQKNIKKFDKRSDNFSNKTEIIPTIELRAMFEKMKVQS